MSVRPFILAGLAWAGLFAHARAGEITVTNLAGLAEAAAQSGQTVTLAAGTYPLADYLTPTVANARVKAHQNTFLTFSGSNNVFRLRGVTIAVDTQLRSAMHMPRDTDDFSVTGDRNVIEGLTILESGNGLSPGGAALSIRGKGNTVRDVTLTVCGSTPYGYGDLFGKGGGDIVLGHMKKSGLLVTGDGTTIAGCTLHMRSFGHGIYLQQNAANVTIEDCLVEGVVRKTDEMLAETNGPAFKADFRTVIRTRSGEKRIQPGYMKSLSEDGFRTYGEHTNLVLRNCTARNMRGGYELRSRAGSRLERCLAEGNERGFWVSSDARVVECRGDAQYGPLLIVEGDRAGVDLTVLPEVSDRTVHALALVEGTGHRIALRTSISGERPKPAPILLGFGAPMMGDGMAPPSEHRSRDVILYNATTMPVEIGKAASGGTIVSRGVVSTNDGKNVVVKPWDGVAP